MNEVNQNFSTKYIVMHIDHIAEEFFDNEKEARELYDYLSINNSAFRLFKAQDITDISEQK